MSIIHTDSIPAPYWRDIAQVRVDRAIVERPGPHLDIITGRLRPPVGTLGEMLERAIYGEPPRPLSARLVDRVLATLSDDETAQAVVALLMPSLRLVVREIVVDLLQEDAA